jgi:hypothetical protein
MRLVKYSHREELSMFYLTVLLVVLIGLFWVGLVWLLRIEPK